MRRPLAALITLTQLHPLVAVVLCLGLGVGASGREQECAGEAGHAAGQHTAVAAAPALQVTVGAQADYAEPEGCPVAAGCAPAAVAPYPSAAHPSGSTPEGIRIRLPAALALSLSQFPPPTPPPNS